LFTCFFVVNTNKAAKRSAPLGYTTKRQYTNFLFLLVSENKMAVIDSANPRIYNKETVYKFSFLIGSGHQLDLFSSVGHSVHLSKNKSTLLSIPKSNSKIIYLSLFIILYYSLRRRIFFVVQGGFQICAAWRTDGTRANEFENNAVIRKKDQPKF
jgi:hypothetical protein